MIRLSREQVREVDRVSIEEYGIPGIVLMENAARSAAEAIEFRFQGDGIDAATAVIVCGGGNNGGDGYAIARLLHNKGWRILIISVKPIDQLRGDALTMANIARAMQLPMTGDLTQIEGNPAHLIIDAVTGTGLTRALEGRPADAVAAMNQSGRRIVAIDLPSGLDCDTGEPVGDACVKADLTVTFVAEKLGFANLKSHRYTGNIVVGDIGCPRAVIDRAHRQQ